MKRIQKLFFTALLLTAIAGSSYAQSQWNGEMPMYDASARYSGGSGTPNDPFLIATAADLAQLAANVNGIPGYSDGQNFRMTSDIDLGGKFDSNTNSWSGTQWKPIGKDVPANPFKGTFDGNGHSIHNLYISSSETDSYNYGLFNIINSGGTIKNLHIASGYIKAFENIGSIAGLNYGNIIACSNNADIEGNSIYSKQIGGIAGSNYNKISACINTGSIGNGDDDFKGGITTRNPVNSCFYVSDTEIGTNTSYRQGIHVNNMTTLNSASVIAILNNILGSQSSFHYEESSAPDNMPPRIIKGSPLKYSIKGNIKDQTSGQPIKGAIVALKLSGSTIDSGKTDTHGNYTLHAVNARGYVIEVSKTGYATETLNAFNLNGSDMSERNGTLSFAPDYAWYMNNPDSYEFSISTTNELRALASITNGTDPELQDNFNNKTIYLTSDLDLGGIYDEESAIWEGAQWEPIGKFETPNGIKTAFRGIFEGNAHSVSNLYIEKPEDWHLGLFGVIESGGIVKNLHISSGSITGENSLGGIAGWNYGHIVACSNNANINGSKSTSRNIAGIAGSNSTSDIFNPPSVVGCFNTGSVINDDPYYTAGTTLFGTEYSNYYVSLTDIGNSYYSEGIRLAGIYSLNSKKVIDNMNAALQTWNTEHANATTPFRYISGNNPETDLPYLAFPTGVCETADETDITVYSSNGAIVIEGIAPGTPYSITGFTGIAFDNGTAAGDRITVSAPQGFYIVKVGAKAAKVEVR